MGRLSKELEQEAKQFFQNKNGILIAISEWTDADRNSSSISKFCKLCGRCLASSPVVSMGEISYSLKGKGLFTVGLIDINNKEVCPIVEEFTKSKQGKRLPLYTCNGTSISKEAVLP